MIRLYNQLMESEGVSEDNIIEFVKELCGKTNVVMSIHRSKSFPFLKKKLELPYICESILFNESLENESCDVQTTLVET